MSMMAFSRDSRHGPSEVRREIMARRATGGVREALYGVLQDQDLKTSAAAMHTALREAGYETSVETVEAALRELAAVLRSPAPTPAPHEPTEPEPESPPDEEPVADVVDLDTRRPVLDPDLDPSEDSEDSEELEDAPPDPLATLYHLVDHDVRLEIRRGNLMAGRETGLTPRLRELLGEHKDALIGLLGEEAVAEAVVETTRYVSQALRGRGQRYGSSGAQRAKRHLLMAQNAYERRDYDLCRYRLRRAEIASEGRYADVELPAPTPTYSDGTPEQRANTSETPNPSERVEAPETVEGDDLEPGRDHQVILNGKAKVILLASLYPTELSLQGAKQAYQRANPSMRVEVRRSRRPE